MKNTNSEYYNFILPNIQARKKGFIYIGLIISCLMGIPLFYIFLIQPSCIYLIILVVSLICIFVLIYIAICRSKNISIAFFGDYFELRTIFSKKKVYYYDIATWSYTNERISMLKKRGTAIQGYYAGYFSVETTINNERRYYPYIYLLGTKRIEEGFILKTKENKYYCISIKNEQNKALESILERKIGRKTEDLGGILSKPLNPKENYHAKIIAVIFPLTGILSIWIFYIFLFFSLSYLKKIPLHWGLIGVDYWGSIYELIFIPIILTVLNSSILISSYHYRNLLYNDRGWKLVDLFFLILTVGIILLLLFLYLPYIFTK